MKLGNKIYNVGKATVSHVKTGVSGMSLVAAILCGLGFSAVSAKSAQAQVSVQFPASKPFKAGSLQLKAKLFKPEGEGKFPAVVLMHGCGGWQPAVKFSLQKHAAMLVKNGFAVLSVDSFGPRRNSGGEVCESFKHLSDARDYRTHDAFDALHYLQQQDFIDADNIFLMGQSNGGSVAIQVAKANAAKKYNDAAPGYRAVVAYYPWCGAFGGRNVKLETPLLVFGGGADDWVPPAACRDVRAKGADLEVKVYPGAVHSFDLEIIRQSYNGKQVGYDKNATDDSRDKMLEFFKANLKDDTQLAEISWTR